MLHFDEHSSGNTIELHLDEEFMITLRENPTTGFRWNLIASGEPACTLLDHSFDSARDTAGDTGSHSWRFQAVNEGAGRIELVYRRAWEQARPPAQSFTLGVRVDSSL